MDPLKAIRWVLACGVFLAGCRNNEPAERVADDVVVTAVSADALRVASHQLTRIELLRPSAHGEDRIRLQRGEDGWRLVEPLSYPANQPAVDAMVAALAELTVLGSIPWSEAAATQRGVTPQASIRVRAWAGERLASDFRVGRSRRDDTSVVREGDARILDVRGRCRPVFDKRAETLRHPVITHVDVEEIERVTYENEHGTLVLVPDGSKPGGFAPSGKTLRNFDEARATKNVGVLSNLTAVGFVDPPIDRDKTGLFEPNTPRATLTLRGARSIDVWIGARTQGGRVYVRTSESDQVYLVSSHLTSSLVVDGSHLERSDELMAELRAHAHRKDESKHRHGGPAHPPSVVPADVLRELRELARRQMAE